MLMIMMMMLVMLMIMMMMLVRSCMGTPLPRVTSRQFQHQPNFKTLHKWNQFCLEPNTTSIPTHPLIAFEHLSLSIVIRNSACRPRQINVDQGRPKQVSILQVSKYPSVQVSQVSKYPSITSMQMFKYPSIPSMQVCKYASMQVCKYASMQVCKQTNKTNHTTTTNHHT